MDNGILSLFLVDLETNSLLGKSCSSNTKETVWRWFIFLSSNISRLYLDEAHKAIQVSYSLKIRN